MIGQCRKRLTMKAHLLASVWVSFLLKGSNPEPVAQIKERSCFLSSSFFFLARSMDSCQCQDCCVHCFMFVRESNRGTCLLFFTDGWDFFILGHQTKLRPVLSLAMSKKDGKETRCPVDIWRFLFSCHTLFFICLLPYVYQQYLIIRP